jgi:hypothetical protein
MSRFKKLFAIIMTIALIAGISAPVALASPVTGDGSIEYVDTDVPLRVSLPTSAALDFTLDPQGLLGLALDGEGKTLADLEEFAGAVIFVDGAPVVVNESAVPVALSVALQITGDATATAESAVDTGTANNIFIGAVASAESVNDEDATREDFAGFLQMQLTGSALAPVFVLDNATYKVFSTTNDGYTYELVPDTGSGTQLKLVGACNPDADWSDFVDKPGTTPAVAAVYTYADVGTQIGGLTSETGAFTINGLTVNRVGSGADSEATFTTAAQLVAALNYRADDAGSHPWVYALANGGDDLTATAKTAGAIGMSGPAAASSAITGTLHDTVDFSGVAGAVSTTGAEATSGGTISASSNVGVSATFTFESVADAIEGGRTPGVAVEGAYGLTVVSGVTWVDPLATGRAALTGAIATFEAAVDVYEELVENDTPTEPTAGQTTTATTAFNTAKAAYETALDLAEGADAVFLTSLAEMYALLVKMHGLIDSSALELPEAPPTDGISSTPRGFIIGGEIVPTRPQANMARNAWVRVTDFEFGGTTIKAMYDGDFPLVLDTHFRTGTNSANGNPMIEMRFATAGTKNIKIVLSNDQVFNFVLVIA